MTLQHIRPYSLALAFVVVTMLSSALLMISGFAQSQSGVASPTPNGPTATPLPDTIGPVDFPSDTNPLTGQALEDPTALARRPLAIKVSNSPAIVRPQAGLSLADLVYEHYVEGNLTRFTAVFYTHTPEYVGSVRSARLIDLQIPIMYQTLFAYSGASGPIRVRISESVFQQRAFENSGAPLFYRDPNIEVPNNLFVVPSEVWNRAEERGVNERPEIEGLVFSPTAPPGADSSASVIALDYGGVETRWRYDIGAGIYRRWVNGEPHRDALNDQQITATNVVVIWTHHQPDYMIVENEWQGHKSYSLELQIWSLGPVTLFRDGQRYEGFWHRWSDEDMLTFWADDTLNERLYLKPGITWFQVVPLDFTGLVADPEIAD